MLCDLFPQRVKFRSIRLRVGRELVEVVQVNENTQLAGQSIRDEEIDLIKETLFNFEVRRRTAIRIPANGEPDMVETFGLHRVEVSFGIACAPILSARSFQVISKVCSFLEQSERCVGGSVGVGSNQTKLRSAQQNQ